MLKTLDNSLEVLNYFTRETPQWGVRELAKEMDMSHSIVYRILSTFEQHGFLMQDQDTKKYALGVRFMELGAMVKENFNIADVIVPVMRRLAAETGESIYLIWRDGLEGICVEIVESSQTIRYGVSVGSRTPLYAGASSKVIMAYLPNDVQEAIIAKGLTTVTEKTIVSREKLLADLAYIQAAGWAYSVGEYTEEVFAIAVPLFDRHQSVIAALAVGGPEYRMPQEKIEGTLQFMKAGRDEIQGLLTKHAVTYRSV